MCNDNCRVSYPIVDGVRKYPIGYRSSNKDRKWKKEVHKRDNDTCVCCKKQNLNPKYAHHLYSHHKNEDLRYDVSNGVTLCKECHLDFHRKYGLKNNTKEQFEEYINNREAN